MTIASDKVVKEMTRYCAAMRDNNHPVDVIYVTKRQFNDLYAAQVRNPDKPFKPRFQGAEVKVNK